MRKILIVGGMGNMGRRYQAILRYRDCETLIYDDIDASQGLLEQYAEECSAIIIATPTNTHLKLLRDLLKFKKPTLVEKPIAPSADAVEKIYAEYEAARVPLQMVNQYAFIEQSYAYDVTEYDFYNSGKDGLAWDCINLIGLAQSDVVLNRDSPYWRVILNGRRLNLQDVSDAYVTMISTWLQNMNKSDGDYAVMAHRKVEEYLATHA